MLLSDILAGRSKALNRSHCALCSCQGLQERSQAHQSLVRRQLKTVPPGYVLVFNSTSGSGLGNAHALARNLSASAVSPHHHPSMHCIFHQILVLFTAPHVSLPSMSLAGTCAGCTLLHRPLAHRPLAAPDSVHVCMSC